MAKGIDYGFTGVSRAALDYWPTGKAAQGGIDCGPRPTQAQLDAAAVLLPRQGTGKHLALAMYGREGGALQAQVSRVTGDTQVNVLRNLIAAGKVVARPLPGEGNAKRYAYALPGAAKGKGKGAAKVTATPAAKVTAKGAAKPAAKGKGKGNVPAVPAKPDRAALKRAADALLAKRKPAATVAATPAATPAGDKPAA